MNALEQRFAALEVANRIRIAGKTIKDELASLDKVAGRRHAANLLLDWHSQTVRPATSVNDLLKSIHRVGPQTVGKWCRLARINPQRRVSNLAVEQRNLLARLLEKDASRIEREQSTITKGRRYGS